MRWLTGTHEAEHHAYFVKERFEELMWWLEMPALCKLATETSPTRSAIAQIQQAVNHSVTLAATAGYRLDRLFELETTERPSTPATEADRHKANETDAAQKQNGRRHSDEKPVESDAKEAEKIKE